MKILITMLGVCAALYFMDKLFLWLENKGWLYYRHRKAQKGIMGNALLELNSFLQPSARHTIEMKQKQVIVKQSEAGDQPDKNHNSQD